MHRVLTIATHEFLETIKTKAFLIGAIIMPMLMIVVIFSTEKVMRVTAQESVPLRRIAVVDHAGGVLAGLQALALQHNAEKPNQPLKFVAAEDDEESLRRLITKGEFYGYLMIPEEAVHGDAPCAMARRDSQLQAGRMLERMLTEAIIGERFQQHEPPIDRELIRRLETPVVVTTIDPNTGQKAGGSRLPSILAPFAFMFLLWMGTLGISQGLLTSVIEEKSSRVVEVLLSAVSPLQFMIGKILGMIMVGAVLIGVWIAVGYSGVKSMQMEHLATGLRLTYFVLYFIPSFLLFSALLAGIGAAFNTLKEAQGMVTPIYLLGVVPMLLWMPISEYPTSALSVTLSFIPPITPFVMMLRICTDPDTPIWQIVTTLALLWVAVAATFWMAGKIFRVGILMYGKPPTPRELFRWIRAA